MHLSGTRSIDHESRSRRAATWLGGVLAAGLIAASLTPAAVAAPTPSPRTNAPAIVWNPSHKDIEPGTSWENDNVIKTTKLLPTADLVFVLDHTKSMEQQITWVADGLSALIGSLENDGAKDIQMGVVSYDDRVTGRIGGKPEDAYQVELPLGSYPIVQVQDKLRKIAADISDDKYNWGGQDSPEDSAWAMMRAAADTKWREGSQHNMVVVTDASTKFRENVKVDGQPVTPAGLTSILEKYQVNAQLQALRADTPTGVHPDDEHATASSIFDFSKEIGIPYSLSQSPEELAANIAVGVTAPEQTWGLTNTISCVYESDGAPSKDLTVTVTPDAVTVEGGDTVTLTERAEAKTTSARPGDATVCTIQTLVNGAPAASQTIRSSVRASGELVLNLGADPASGTVVAPGSTVTYTVSAENKTNGPLATASFDTDLSAVFDDAEMVPDSLKVSAVGNPDRTEGTAKMNGQMLRWEGDLAVDAKAFVTFQVKVADAPKGDLLLTNRVSTTGTPSNCSATTRGPGAAVCSTSHQISAAPTTVTPTPPTAVTPTAAPTPAKVGLPTTGSEALRIGIIAVLALALGAGVLIVVRRRSQQQK